MIPKRQQNNPIVRFFSRSFLHFAYLFKKPYAYAVIKNNFSLPMFPKESKHLCIANREDAVVYHTQLSKWLGKMKSAGHDVSMEIFEGYGHLKAHKDKDKYERIWQNFLQQGT